MLNSSGAITACTLWDAPASILEIFETFVPERTENWQSLRYDLIPRGGGIALILWRIPKILKISNTNYIQYFYHYLNVNEYLFLFVS